MLWLANSSALLEATKELDDSNVSITNVTMHTRVTGIDETTSFFHTLVVSSENSKKHVYISVS